MHVGVYVHNYVPTAGGGYTFQREILKEIVDLTGQSGLHFSVLASASNDLLDIARSGTVGVIPLEQPYGPFLKPARFLQKVFKKSFADHLTPLGHTTRKHKIEFIWFLTPAYEVTNLPYIATVWDLQHRLQPWFPEVGNLREWLGRESYVSTFLQRATYIIAANETARNEISRFYQIPETRIACLGHPTPALAPASSNEITEALNKYDLKPGYLFYPAQYWAHKNHANLLYALQTLKEQYSIALQVAFVGSDKGNLPYLKKLADDLGLASQIHFLGFVSDVEMTALYKNALALVFLSFFGPENLPPLEAFSIGCPVIASRVNGADEQLGDAALLVNPIDVKEIAQAVLAITDEEKRQALIARGYERVKDLTSLNYVHGIVALLEEFQYVRRAWGDSC